jgi:hypothetical protein
MKKATLLRLLLAIYFVFSAVAVQAGTIATWTFEISQPSGTDQTTNPPAGGYAPEIGVGSAMGVHASAAADWSNPSGNGSAESWNSNNWASGDYYQFQASTLGKSGIVFSWDQTRSSSGPATFHVQYGTDGSNFTNMFTYAVPITSSSGAVWTSQVADLSSVSALDNQANVFFRVTAFVDPTSTNGQSRIDNVSVTFIPEPVTAALLLVAMLAVGVHRRSR